ncbi:MAG: Sua5/YciO/YrdC/YwlC family protein, partial [Solirubrobacterales bacterium]|nr:Sua5/YciO/YrdC/YwlC family protein [Solirubrobacterales bacterium]
MITRADVAALERCLAGGGVALLPTDTLYGLACDPDSPVGVARLYEIKGRVKQKPAAVMFATLAAALEALPELDEAVRGAVRALLPGPVTLLVPNPRRRFPLACPRDPELLGVRVPAW